MKRTRTALAGIDKYELRNKKVQKILHYPIKDLTVLAENNVWPNVLRLHLLMHWWNMWKNGKVQLFRSSFNDGDIFMQRVHINPFNSAGLFGWWHEFLLQVTTEKAKAGVSHLLSIQEGIYWSISKEMPHTWTSYHKGKEVIMYDSHGDNEHDNPHWSNEHSNYDAKYDGYIAYDANAAERDASAFVEFDN